MSSPGKPTVGVDEVGLVRRLVVSVAEALESQEAQLGELDAKAGDGDTGASLAIAGRAARGVAVESEVGTTASALLRRVARSTSGVGGAIGAISYVILDEIARCLDERSSGKEEVESSRWLADMLGRIAGAVEDFGGAKAGDRSILDAIEGARQRAAAASKEGRPLVDTLTASAEGARSGADSTANMVATVGRASRVRGGDVGAVDAGAEAFAVALGAAARTMSGSADRKVVS